VKPFTFNKKKKTLRIRKTSIYYSKSKNRNLLTTAIVKKYGEKKRKIYKLKNVDKVLTNITCSYSW